MPMESPPAESFWIQVEGEKLSQGDYLLDCPVPIFPANYGSTPSGSTVEIARGNLIVVTQSCDLENNKVKMVALCPIYTIAEFTSTDDKKKLATHLEEIRRGKFEALHMLSSTQNPESNMDVRIVDFRDIYCLPVQFLGSHAAKLGKRWRLKSPYLEHFSQAFARFFMRVGLPSTIQKFK